MPGSAIHSVRSTMDFNNVHIRLDSDFVIDPNKISPKMMPAASDMITKSKSLTSIATNPNTSTNTRIAGLANSQNGFTIENNSHPNETINNKTRNSTTKTNYNDCNNIAQYSSSYTRIRSKSAAATATIVPTTQTATNENEKCKMESKVTTVALSDSSKRDSKKHRQSPKSIANDSNNSNNNSKSKRHSRKRSFSMSISKLYVIQRENSSRSNRSRSPSHSREAGNNGKTRQRSQTVSTGTTAHAATTNHNKKHNVLTASPVLTSGRMSGWNVANILSTNKANKVNNNDANISNDGSNSIAGSNRTDGKHTKTIANISRICTNLATNDSNDSNNNNNTNSNRKKSKRVSVENPNIRMANDLDVSKLGAASLNQSVVSNSGSNTHTRTNTSSINTNIIIMNGLQLHSSHSTPHSPRSPRGMSLDKQQHSQQAKEKEKEREKRQSYLDIAMRVTNLVLLSMISVMLVLAMRLLGFGMYFLIVDSIVTSLTIYLSFKFGNSFYQCVCYCHKYFDLFLIYCCFDVCFISKCPSFCTVCLEKWENCKVAMFDWKKRRSMQDIDKNALPQAKVAKETPQIEIANFSIDNEIDYNNCNKSRLSHNNSIDIDARENENENENGNAIAIGRISNININVGTLHIDSKLNINNANRALERNTNDSNDNNNNSEFRASLSVADRISESREIEFGNNLHKNGLMPTKAKLTISTVLTETITDKSDENEEDLTVNRLSLAQIAGERRNSTSTRM